MDTAACNETETTCAWIPKWIWLRHSSSILQEPMHLLVTQTLLCGRWRAHIREKHLGVYMHEKDAAEAYDIAALKLRLQRMHLNLGCESCKVDCAQQGLLHH